MTKYIIRTVVLSAILSSGCANISVMPLDGYDGPDIWSLMGRLIRSKDQTKRSPVIQHCEDILQSTQNHGVEYTCAEKYR